MLWRLVSSVSAAAAAAGLVFLDGDWFFWRMTLVRGGSFPQMLIGAPCQQKTALFDVHSLTSPGHVNVSNNKQNKNGIL